MEPAKQNVERGAIRSFSLLGARVTWVALGPMLLLLTTVGIIRYGGGWLTFVDAFFVLLVGLMVLGRWIEMRSGSATTAEGDPANWSHFRQYVAWLLPIAGGVWIAANVLGNHLLAGRA
ncbi:MAG: hypothetical protein U1D55_16665 [Phycisphaerae bacterium]